MKSKRPWHCCCSSWRRISILKKRTSDMIHIYFQTWYVRTYYTNFKKVVPEMWGQFKVGFINASRKRHSPTKQLNITKSFISSQRRDRQECNDQLAQIVNNQSVKTLTTSMFKQLTTSPSKSEQLTRQKPTTSPSRLTTTTSKANDHCVKRQRPLRQKNLTTSPSKKR